MEKYNQLTKDNQDRFKIACQAYLNIEFTDNQWSSLVPFINLDHPNNSMVIEESARLFCNIIISFDPTTDKPEYLQTYLSDFKDNLSELDLLNVINITYDMMSHEQKGYMLDYVAKHTGYIFEPENMDKLFSTAPSDCAFSRLSSSNPDTYDKQFFTPFIWARLIGEDAPTIFEFQNKQEKLAARIKNEGHAMFDALYDHKVVFDRIVNGH